MTPTDPAPPEPALQVAARLLAEGRPADAAERLGALVAEAPIYAAAHVLRATALEAAGFVDEAIVSWGRAAALVPRSPLVHRERERLLATRLADDLPSDLPAAVPGLDRPDVAEAAALGSAGEGAPPDLPQGQKEGREPPAADPDDVFGTAQTIDAADLLFTDTPTPPAGATLAASAPTDWASLPPAQAPILPPEGSPPTPPTPAMTPEDETGWGVLDEVDVPTPPPGTHAEPDVVAPEGSVSQPPTTVADELDALITQLEDAPRIRPDPNYQGPEVALDAGDVDDLASETLAKIYAAQHQYVEAALVYEKLAARQPEQADELLERAAELRQRRP